MTGCFSCKQSSSAAFNNFFIAWRWLLRRDIFLTPLISCCDRIRRFAGLCIQCIMWQRLDKLKELENGVFQTPWMSFKSSLFLAVAALHPAEFHISRIFSSGRATSARGTIQTCTLRRRRSSLSLILPSFSGAFAPLLPSSPPCLSWPPWSHLFSRSEQVCKLLLVLAPICRREKKKNSLSSCEKNNWRSS